MLVNTNEQNMLPAQRRSAIARFIREMEACDTEALSKHFGVSSMTIRRDLKELERSGLVHLTHGGAVSPQCMFEDVPYPDKVLANLEAKKAIAGMAAERIKDNTCIILDAGTTTLELARLLVGRTLTVITTDLQIALFLVAVPGITVHTTGGLVDPVSRAHKDTRAVRMLMDLRVPQAFMGTNVWDAGYGVTSSSSTVQQVKMQMMASASEAILLADSSKYGRFSTWVVGGLNKFSAIISDDGLAQAQRQAIMQAGGTLQVAPSLPDSPQGMETLSHDTGL